ncbi:hypothetical protein [Pseudolabrys sp. FHR47]|uniref:hypothetical protein n=1 Tax=Pseudolabrys sp. FHR47 TaxID=2562284 RepID=UPI0010BEF6C7|nr:hypothetical protein [Pseudolabrys sp. FHR47]
MQVFLTVLSAVLVFVISQALLRFFFEPLQNFNRERGDLSFLLLYYGIPGLDRAKTVQDDDYNLGLIGPSLLACIAQIPFYDYFAALSFLGLPNRGDVQNAIVLTATVTADIRKETAKARDSSVDTRLIEIARLLKVPEPRVSSVSERA